MNRPRDLEGRPALVTGAAHGIGAAVVAELAARGAAVTALDLSPDVLGARGAGAVEAVVGDVTVQEVLADAVELACAQGASDAPAILVHSVFAHTAAPLLDLEPGQWDRAQNAMLSSVQRGDTAFVRGLCGRPASVVHIASPHAFGAVPGFAAYAAAKAGLLALTRAAAVEWGALGVRCNAVAPGFIPVERNRAVWHDPERRETLLRGTPLGRFGSTDEMARAVGFLASDESSFVTGTCLVADGGMTAMLPEALLR